MAHSGQSNHTNNSSVHARPNSRPNASARAPNFAFSADRGFVMIKGVELVLTDEVASRSPHTPTSFFSLPVSPMRRTDTVNLSVLALDACRTNRSRPAGQNTTRGTSPPHIRDRKGPTTHTVEIGRAHV